MGDGMQRPRPIIRRDRFNHDERNASSARWTRKQRTQTQTVSATCINHVAPPHVRFVRRARQKRAGSLRVVGGNLNRGRQRGARTYLSAGTSAQVPSGACKVVRDHEDRRCSRAAGVPVCHLAFVFAPVLLGRRSSRVGDRLALRLLLDVPS